MKIQAKYLTVKGMTQPVATVLSASTAPRVKVTQRAYQQLVTRQDVAPARAKQLLGWGEK
jgi:hypothetical protein